MRQVKGISITHNSKNWHKKEKDRVYENENLPIRPEYNDRSYYDGKTARNIKKV